MAHVHSFFVTAARIAVAISVGGTFVIWLLVLAEAASISAGAVPGWIVLFPMIAGGSFMMLLIPAIGVGFVTSCAVEPSQCAANFFRR